MTSGAFTTRPRKAYYVLNDVVSKTFSRNLIRADADLNLHQLFKRDRDGKFDAPKSYNRLLVKCSVNAAVSHDAHNRLFSTTQTTTPHTIYVVRYKHARPISDITMVSFNKTTSAVKQALRCFHALAPLNAGFKLSRKAKVGTALAAAALGLALLPNSSQLPSPVTPTLQTLPLVTPLSNINPANATTPNLLQPSSPQLTRPIDKYNEAVTHLNKLEEDIEVKIRTLDTNRVELLTVRQAIATAKTKSTAQLNHPTAATQAGFTTLETREQEIDESNATILAEIAALRSEKNTELDKLEQLSSQVKENNLRQQKQLNDDTAVSLESNQLIRSENPCSPQANGKLLTKPIITSPTATSYETVDTTGNRYVITEQLGNSYLFLNQVHCLNKLKDTDFVPKLVDAYRCPNVNAVAQLPENTKYGYVTEKLDTITLLQFLTVNQPVLKLQSYLQAIKECLLKLDKNRVVHRNLTLYNILLKDRQADDLLPAVYITDFRYAYDLDKPTSVVTFKNIDHAMSSPTFYDKHPDALKNVTWFLKYLQDIKRKLSGSTLPPNDDIIKPNKETFTQNLNWFLDHLEHPQPTPIDNPSVHDDALGVAPGPIAPQPLFRPLNQTRSDEDQKIIQDFRTTSQNLRDLQQQIETTEKDFFPKRRLYRKTQKQIDDITEQKNKADALFETAKLEHETAQARNNSEIDVATNAAAIQAAKAKLDAARNTQIVTTNKLGRFEQEAEHIFKEFEDSFWILTNLNEQKTKNNTKMQLLEPKYRQLEKKQVNALNINCFESVKQQIASRITGQSIHRLHQRCYAMLKGQNLIKEKPPLDKGEYGEVWDVEGTYNDQIIIKEQTSHCYSFIIEINCLEKLQSTKYVPKIYDSYVCFPDINSTSSDVLTETVVYGYVMEKLHMTLYNFLTSGFPKSVITHVAKEIAGCLKALDAAHIVHRDLHVKNIMLKFSDNTRTNKSTDKTPRVCIIDFGNAYITTDPTTVSLPYDTLGVDSELTHYQNNPTINTNYFWFKRKSDETFEIACDLAFNTNIRKDFTQLLHEVGTEFAPPEPPASR
jgi:tRNA A-37 threonylcarbamoyl transferase component Bud32